jgi:predicted lipoprotein with Yx(FWY)xxD motif
MEAMQMKRAPLLVAGLIVAAPSTAAVASSAGGAARAHDSRTTKIQLRRTEIGKVLVDGSGFTLYRFSKDPRNSDMCVKIKECTNLWPPVMSSGRPVAGPGVRAALLSTIKLSGGGRQVTYAGHPLYRYSPATEKGETAYVGAQQFGGTWYAVNAAGRSVK